MKKKSLRDGGEAFTAFYSSKKQNYQFNCLEQLKVVKLHELRESFIVTLFMFLNCYFVAF